VKSREDFAAVESGARALARLKPREQAFATAWAAGFDQTAAAIFAGVPQRSAASRGSEMAARPRVQAAVAALRLEAAKESGITPAEVLRQVREDRALAYEKGAPAAAIRATELAAKVAGVVSPGKDRQRITVRIVDYTGRQVADVETESGDEDE
jgi:phage terminase small subunit